MAKRKQRSDTKPEKTHSGRTALINFFRIVGFLLPLPVYIFITVFLFPSPNSGFLVAGILGTFFVGLSILSIVSILDGLYFGPLLTTILFGIGSLLIGISSFIMYTPSIYAQLNEQHITYYFLIWTFLIMLAICYIFFRMATTQFLKECGINKSAQKKIMKSSSDYWLYKSIHDRGYMRHVYHWNLHFIVISVSVFVIHLLLGWWYPVSFVTAALFCIACVISFVMWISLLSQWKQSYFPLSLQITGVIFPLVMCIVTAIYVFKMME